MSPNPKAHSNPVNGSTTATGAPTAEAILDLSSIDLSHVAVQDVAVIARFVERLYCHEGERVAIVAGANVIEGLRRFYRTSWLRSRCDVGLFEDARDAQDWLETARAA